MASTFHWFGIVLINILIRIFMKLVSLRSGNEGHHTEEAAGGSGNCTRRPWAGARRSPTCAMSSGSRALWFGAYLFRPPACFADAREQLAASRPREGVGGRGRGQGGEGGWALAGAKNAVNS